LPTGRSCATRRRASGGSELAARNVRGVAAVSGGAGAAVCGLCAVRGGRAVSVAHRAALCLANPFAGIKVKGASRSAAIDVSHVFSEHEWALIRPVADGLEWTGGWTEEGAQRLRFVLDFWYATGLRPSEIVAAVLGHIEDDARHDPWLNVLGKGSKRGKVVLPLLARGALDRYLAQRELPVTPRSGNRAPRWCPRSQRRGPG
jgi:integrase